MTTKFNIVAALLTAVVIVSVPILYASVGNGGNVNAVSGERSCKHGKKQGHCRFKDARTFQKLNLTEAQEKQMQGIWKQKREAMKAVFEQVKTSREALNTELEKPTVDMNRINALQGQLKGLAAQLADEHLNTTLEVKKILTSEQFGKFLRSQQRMFMGHFHQGGHGNRHERADKDWDDEQGG